MEQIDLLENEIQYNMNDYKVVKVDSDWCLVDPDGEILNTYKTEEEAIQAKIEISAKDDFLANQ